MPGIADIDLLIVGAPKCATSSLWAYLSEHPRIVPAFRGESQYLWDGHPPPSPSDPDTAGPRVRLPAARPAGCTYFLDKSVWHLYYSKGIERLRQIRPDARIIIVLRDPADLLYRLHGQFVKVDQEKEVRFRKVVRRLDKVGWRLTGDRRADPYVLATRLKEHTLQWVEAFGPNVCIIGFEAFRSDPGGCYARVLDWLGLEGFQPHLAHHNVAARPVIRGVNRALTHPPGWLSRTARLVIPQARARRALGGMLQQWNLRRWRRPPLPDALRTSIRNAIPGEFGFTEDLTAIGGDAFIIEARH